MTHISIKLWTLEYKTWSRPDINLCRPSHYFRLTPCAWMNGILFERLLLCIWMLYKYKEKIKFEFIYITYMLNFVWRYFNTYCSKWGYIKEEQEGDFWNFSYRSVIDMWPIYKWKVKISFSGLKYISYFLFKKNLPQKIEKLHLLCWW